MKKTYVNENLKKFCINFDEQGRFYNFLNAWEVVFEFLTIFENIFTPRWNLRQVSFKSTFTIVNHQHTPRVGFAEITGSREWQTNVYDGVYFNDYVKPNLEGNILKRDVMNGMIGSSRKFKRFDRLCITIKSDQYRCAGK